MGHACLSKHQSQEFVGPAGGGRYIASVAPELVSTANGKSNGHIGGREYVKIGKKAGVLHLNDPIPDEPSEEEKAKEAARRAKEEAAKNEEAAKRKEEQKRKQEEQRRQKEEARKSREEEEVRKAEMAAKKKEDARREEEEAKRRMEEERKQKLEEEARLKEEAKDRQEEQKRLEEEAREEARRRQEELRARRKSDDARMNTYNYKKLKHSYQNDFQAFLVNNTLMAIQFGDEREIFEKARGVCTSDVRENEMNTRMTATGHLKKAVAPDAIHEYLSQMIRFTQEDTAYVANGVPLRPIRVMISHEDILVQHQMDQTLSRPSKLTRLCVEQATKERETTKSGYVRLLNMDTKILKSRSQERLAEDPQEGYPTFSDPEDQGPMPVLIRVPEASSSDSDEFEDNATPFAWSMVANAPSRRPRPSYPNVTGSSSSSGYRSGSILSVPKSNYSNSDSEHSYSTIETLRRQQLLADRRLQLEGATCRVGLPRNCFLSTTVPSYNENSDQLFKTKYYLGSSTFMDYFSAVFADMLAGDLGYLPVWVNEATVCGPTISIKTTQQAKLEIIPTISCKPENWPEKAVEFIWRQRIEAFDQRTQKLYKWPSNAMIREATTMGYHMIPFGYVPKRGSNQGFDREWKIEFPEAERYLESCLNDTQMRCYLFCLLLFQSFFKQEGSVTEDHLRHVIFWQAENLTLAWANYEMFNNIRAVYESLYENLSRTELPNYFIRSRNEFQSIPQPRLQAVQKLVKNFRENPFGHIVAALRRLHIEGRGPKLNLTRLLELIKTEYAVELANPALRMMVNDQQYAQQPATRRGSNESEGFWADVRKSEDPKKNWRRQLHRNLEEQQRRQVMETRRRASGPPKTERSRIEVKVTSTTFFDALRRRLVLEFFIDHFVQMALNPAGRKVSSEVLHHAKNLLCLYFEYSGQDDGRGSEWSMQLKRIHTAPKEAQQRLQRGPMELPPESKENWTLQSVDVEMWKGRRLMMDAPPTMVFHRADEESEVISTDGTDL